MGGEFVSYMIEGHESPTARWLLSTDVDQRQAYIVHLGSPSFIAKISDTSDVGLLSGTSFGMRDGRNLFDFIFYGNEPASESELVGLLKDAEAAIVAAHGQAA
jgi:hypothetical protein